ncbi:MAG: mechanosensitive ion channel family protein [Anaerolineae bacterium]|nr:mechanosensitive ion channel family protein [Anaerolineae bacterium]
MISIEGITQQFILPIGLILLIAWIIHRSSPRIVRHTIGLAGYAPQKLRPSEERQRTLADLFASALSFLVFVIAAILILGLFIDTTTLVWMIGLFSAAFGLGARPLISDFLTGIGFIFEDTFDVGEKVEILGTEGVVEKINLRTTLLRAPSGELYTIPNGEIRMIRNFSRGRFSTANIMLKIAANDLSRAIELLESLGDEAVTLLPNLLEPWQVISESGTIGGTAELTLLTRARFGKAAEMRPRLLALVQERLAQAEITLVG